MKLYKLTDSNDCTRNDTQWGEGIEHTASGEGDLCSSGFIHAYEHQLVAVFMNPIHANFQSPHLWLADGDVSKRGGQLKCGCTRLKTIKRIELPDITTEQRVEVAIRVTKLICDNEAWNTWADKWLSGEDRTTGAAAEARAGGSEARAAEFAAAARAVAAARAEAAGAAAWAGAAEARAAAWAGAAEARAVAEARVAWTEDMAALAAARAAWATTKSDLTAILEEVCGGEP